MKLQCTTQQLLSAVSLASRFVGRQNNLPILNSLLLSAENGALLVRATNLECGVEVSVGAKVLDGGVVAVPAHTLLGFLSHVRENTITSSLQGGVLQVKTDHATASVKIVSHDDFPLLPRISAEHSFIVKAADLSKAIRFVVQCAATSTIKPELQSVLVYADAGKLTCAATDSFRLAEKQVPLKSRGSVPHLLIPARNASELVRILDGVQGDVELYYNEHQLSVQVDVVYYTTRLLDGTFPNYQQIIPNGFSTEVVVLREDLSQALKGLLVFSDKFLQVVLLVNPKQKTIELSSHNADVGEEECSLKAAVKGDEVKMTFNSRYLGDGLIPVMGESVRLQMNGPGKAMVIKDASDDSYLYLAMPMNR